MGQQIAHVVGIKPWKRWQINAFLKPLYSRVSFAGSARQALNRQRAQGGDIVVWAARETDGLNELALAQGARLLRMEDGFIRSVGLGSNHVGGASLVLDDLGIYYDPRQPSRLERILQSDAFDSRLVERASRLRKHLVSQRLTKYNIGHPQQGIRLGGGRRRKVLVPGQVSNDASVRCGTTDVSTNLELLRAVRAGHPDAWVIYKPHPDTEAGTRPGQMRDLELRTLADEVVRGVSPVDLFDQIDEVHTMTSLLGFEALLRDVPVHVYGQPFYAGWGLTHDYKPCARRTRRLSKDELVAGALLRYARYVHPETLKPCEAEDVLACLANKSPASPEAQRSVLRRILRLGQGLYRSWKS